MWINANVSKQQVENILNQIGELYTTVGEEVILYPLRIVSGIISFTENGEFDIKYNHDNFTSNVDVITSNAPIVCYWEGSYKSKNPEGVENPLYQVKELSAENGKKIKTWVMQYSTESMIDTAEINNAQYTTIMLNRSIRSFSRDWVPSDNEMKRYLYLYLNKKAKSPQFLRMTRKEPRYLPSGKLAGCELEFENLNILFSNSGKDVMNFVKMTNPGSNYPFPEEVETPEGTVVQLSETKANNRGVRDIQLEFDSSYALNMIEVWGRPKSNEIIEAPRRLLLHVPHPAISSALDVSGSSLNNYYASFCCKPIYNQFWDNWSTKVSAYYNYTAKKTFNGGLKCNYSETTGTNPIADDSRTYNMWNNWVFSPSENRTFQCPEVSMCDSEITFFNNEIYRPQDFLNHNSFIFSAMEALPIEYSESTRWSLSTSFGTLGKIIGGFVQTFTGGFDPGWTTNNVWVPGKPINLLFPTTPFNIGRAMCADETLQPIPYDVFDNTGDITSAGNKINVCGYRYELTHYFRSPSQTIEGNEAGKGGSGVWDTKYLGQTTFENGEPIFDDPEQKVTWKSDCRSYSPLIANEEYEVDIVCYQGIGKTDCRMTFFNYINNDPANVESIYEARQMTNAKFKDDMTLWRNVYYLNYSEEANNEGSIEYPQNVVPPTPQPKSLEISEFVGLYNYCSTLSKDTYGSKVTSTPFSSEGLWFLLDDSKSHYRRYIVQFQMKREDKGKWTDDGKTKICSGGFSVDLSPYIGPDNINKYKSISFQLSIKTATTIQYTKQVEISIQNWADNTWTPVKAIDINDIINSADPGSFPKIKWSDFIDGGDYRYETKYNMNPILEISKTFSQPTTDIWFWGKLDKENQILTIGFDNPEHLDQTQGAPKTMTRTFVTDWVYNTEPIGWFGAQKTLASKVYGYMIENFYLNPVDNYIKNPVDKKWLEKNSKKNK